MLVELKRNPTDWFGHVKFVAMMVAALLLMVVAAIWMFTWGTSALTSRSNLGVAFGAVFTILLLIGLGAGLWVWGIKFARHFRLLALLAIVLSAPPDAPRSSPAM